MIMSKIKVCSFDSISKLNNRKEIGVSIDRLENLVMEIERQDKITKEEIELINEIMDIIEKDDNIEKYYARLTVKKARQFFKKSNIKKLNKSFVIKE